MKKKMERSCAGDGKTARYTVVKVRLHPTAEQAELMEKTFGACRYLWNKMLEDVQEFYAAADVHYIPTPARYKKEAPFLKEIDSQALCAVHQNLRKAFLDFFRNPAVFQYPKFKTKKARKDSFTVYCRPYHTGPSIRLAENGLQMPKLGLVQANIYRKPPLNSSLRSVTVTKTKSGKYFASITFGYEIHTPQTIVPALERTLGLNYSLTRFYVDSEGSSPTLPPLAKSKEKLARMQQKLSRMNQGSRNYEKQLQKIRLLHEHIANQRKDFIHKESRRIANAWDAVCVRETDLVVLSQKLKQAHVMDSGFGMFRLCLKYKLEQQGKPFVVVGQPTPDAKACHTCGAAVSGEVNAARNIRDMGLAQLQNKEKSVA